MISPARVLAAVGAVLFVCGFALGFLPFSADGASCGSVFLAKALAGNACQDRHDTWQIIVWLLIIAGAATWIASIVLVPKLSAADRAEIEAYEAEEHDQ